MSHHNEEPVYQESLLDKILEKEKELDDAIAQAKVEAEKIIDDAEAKAAEMVSAAKKEKMKAEDARKEALKEALTARASQGRREEQDKEDRVAVEKLQAKIEQNIPKAVAEIIKVALSS